MPVKPFNQMSDDELQKQAEGGLKAQQSVLDKLWYKLNYGAYVKTIVETRNMSKDVEFLLDTVPKDPVELAEAKKAYKREHPLDHFSDEEMQSIPIPIDPAAQNKLEDAEVAMEEQLIADCFPCGSLDEIVQSYKLLGLLGAKVAIECGKDYEQKLADLEGEEYREEKAEYLSRKDALSKAGILSHAYRSFQGTLTPRLLDKLKSPKILRGTPVESLDTLKKATIREYLSACMSSKEQMDEFFKGDRKIGFECDPNTPAFEYFKRLNVFTEERYKQDHKDYVPKIKTDEEILISATDQFKQRLFKNAQMFGSRIVRESLSEKEKKSFDIGYKNISEFEPRTPECIQEWAKTTAPAKLLENRVQRFADTHNHFRKEADRKKTYGMEKDPAYRRAFGTHLRKNASQYEKFIHKHLGANSLPGGREERRARLALVMAANSIEATSPGVFDRDVIRDVAETIMRRGAFRKLSDMDVSEALLNKQSALNAQKRMIRDAYGVPENDRAEYIRKMKALADTMVPGKGQSEKYRAMFDAVSAIAKLDPADQRIEDKLISANAKLFNRVSDYTKGKKSLRSFNTSQARFDNSIDVLAVVNEHVPGLKPDVKAIVDRTNEVRKTKLGDKHYVNLADYGTERSQAHAPKNAAINRQPDAVQNAQEDGPALGM